MPSEALKTTVITNLDASPPLRPTSGFGGSGRVEHVDGVITTTTGKTSGSTYRMARVPSNAIIKDIKAWLDAAATTLTGDIGVYYSSAGDGTSTGNTGLVIDADFFASAVALGAVVTKTEYSTESGTYTGAKRKQPLWQAVGLTADPGGFFDIVLTTTATNSDAATLNVEVLYVMPPG